MNTVPQVKNSYKSLKIIGTATAGGLIAWIFYKLFRKHKKQKFTPEQIKEIMLKFSRDYYPIYIYLWDCFEKISRSYLVQYKVLPQNVIKMIQKKLLEDNERFQNMVFDLEKKIYKLYNVTDIPAVQSEIQRLAKEDNEIQLALQEIRKMIQLTSQGKGLDFDIKLPDFVTAAKSFAIYRDTVRETLFAVNDFFLKYEKEHNNVRHSHQQISKLLHNSFDKNMIVERVLSEAGYDSHPELHEQFLLKASLVQCMKNEHGFQSVIKKIDKAKDLIIKEHFALNADFQGLREKIEQMSNTYIWK